MMPSRRFRQMTFAALTGAVAGYAPLFAQQQVSAVVDTTLLRVCSDPAAMPNSNKAGEGFENKIAEILAADLGIPVQYEWYPQATGFVRNTLRAGKCDVILGYPQGDEEVQSTNPYYRSAWSLVTPEGSPLSDVKALNDPRLQDKRFGVQAGAPPGNAMAMNGLMGHVRPYGLMEDRRVSSAPERMMADLKAGEIDAGILWGPVAAYAAGKAGLKVSVVPLVSETKGPRLDFFIGMGVRPRDQDWKRKLNTLLTKHKSDIEKVLVSYGIPLLDTEGAVAP